MNLTRVHLHVRPAGRTDAPADDEHLVVEAHETAWLSAADVIISSVPSPQAAKDVRAFLAAYPGAVVVAVRAAGGGCVVGTRDGRLVVFAAGDPATLGSIAHAWTVTGGRLDALEGARIRATVTRATPPAAPAPVRPAARPDR